MVFCWLLYSFSIPLGSVFILLYHIAESYVVWFHSCILSLFSVIVMPLHVVTSFLQFHMGGFISPCGHQKRWTKKMFFILTAVENYCILNGERISSKVCWVQKWSTIKKCWERKGPGPSSNKNQLFICSESVQRDAYIDVIFD